MTGILVHDQYGKGDVRVSKIKRLPDRHEFVEARITVVLEGQFQDSFIKGDNHQIIATDSIRNTIYLKAKDDPWESIEGLGMTLARHFVSIYDHVNKATITLREHVWHRIGDGSAAFTGSDVETPVTTVRLERGRELAVESGLDELMLAKTTDTAFKGFVDDQYRTLPDADDRILATVLNAMWAYNTTDVDFITERKAIRDAMLDKFAHHMSWSVQQSIYLLGQAALEASGAITQITLTMPNKHHIKFNTTPFGLENNNEIFHVTDEPFGWISGTVARQ